MGKGIHLLPFVKLTIVVCVVSAMQDTAPLWSQEPSRIEIPSSFTPVGSGARALGMGGAYIGLADDATAASWNPGGLFQIGEPKASIVLSTYQRNEDNSFETHQEASGNQSVSSGDINYVSFAYPLNNLPYRVVVAATYQYLFDMNRSWHFPLNIDSGLTVANQEMDYEQSGGLSALGLSCNLQLMPSLGVGITLNIWDAGFNLNQWEQDIRQERQGTIGENRFQWSLEAQDRYTFSGYNLNIGMLWECIEDKLKIGIVFKSPFKADLRHESRYHSDWHFPDNPQSDTSRSNVSVDDETLEMPMTYGLGFSYRLRPRLLVNLDISRTEWSDFVLEDAQGNRKSPITGKPLGDSDIKATHQIRLGGQMIIRRHAYTSNYYDIPIRAGVFYDPAPAEGRPDDYYGFSLGTGIKLGPAGYANRLAFDIAYQYRYGNDVNTVVFEALDFSQDVHEHSVFISTIMIF